MYLNAEERRQALVLSQSLAVAREMIEAGEKSPQNILNRIRDIIETAPLARIDYVELYRADDLAEIDMIEGRILIALAVKFGNTRLIDNLLVEV